MLKPNEARTWYLRSAPLSEAARQIVTEYLDAYLGFYPSQAVGLGLHEYDGQLSDLSPEAVDRRVRNLSEFERRAAAIMRDSLPQDEAHDLALVESALRRELVDWTRLRTHERDPLSYSWLLDVTIYLKRNYAPLEKRARALIDHLEAVPAVMAHARRHLSGEPLPRPHVETALEVYRGHVDFYERSLPEALAAIADRPLYERFLRARAAAADAVTAYLRWLDAEARPRAVDAFAIGADRFSEMLAAGEMVTTRLDVVLRLGEEELRRNTEAADQLARDLDPGRSPHDVIRQIRNDHPGEDRLMDETSRLLEGLRRFLTERGIVTVPGESRPLVEPTPPFARWAFAMMDTAGPFEETAAESYFYVTPPEPDWTADQREEWLRQFDYHTLKVTSIHEAYPGHFIHFLHVKGTPSRAARILGAYSFVEGWAHYGEEMMVEQGVDPDPRLHLAQVADALVRNVRYVAAIGMHTGEMTVDQAARLFVDRGFMEELPARKEAVRGTFDPGYLNYLLGKLMIRKLRHDVQREQGAAFSLRGFHDRLLDLGAPPVPLARRVLLQRDDGILF